MSLSQHNAQADIKKDVAVSNVSLLDQLEPLSPPVVLPPIHFTHVLGPLFSKQLIEFDENKNCNLPFYDYLSQQQVTPLSYLVGYNPEHKIYHEEVEKLLQHPDLCLTTLCDKNLFKFLVLNPTEKNKETIQKLCASGIKITEKDVVEVLTSFTDETFSFEDKRCDRQLAAQAFEEMLKAPLTVDCSHSSENKVTPLLIAFRIKKYDCEDINPFAQIIINVIKKIIIKKIISQELYNENKLLIFLKRMAGIQSDQHHQLAYQKLLEQCKSLEVHFDPNYVQPISESILGLMTHKELNEKERDECSAFQTAVDTHNLPLAYDLMEAVEYTNPEELVDIVLKKKDDNFYGFIHGLFNLGLSHFLSVESLAKLFVQYQQTHPKCMLALLISFRGHTLEWIEDFEEHYWISFETDRLAWEKSYKEFLIKKFNFNNITDYHWRFLLRWAVRYKIEKCIEPAEMKSAVYLTPCDLRDYAFYAFSCDRFDQAIAALKEIEVRNKGKLSLEDLMLLSKANYHARSKENTLVQRLKFVTEETLANLRCEILQPWSVDNNHCRSMGNIISTMTTQMISGQSQEVLSALELRMIADKFFLLGELFLAKKSVRSQFVFATIVTLLNAIPPLIINLNDKKALAYSLFHSADLAQSNQQISEKYNLVKKYYLEVILESGRLKLQDWDCLYQSILYIIEIDMIKNKNYYKSTEFCDELIQALLRKSIYMEDGEERFLVKKILNCVADNQVKLCTDLSTSLCQLEVTVDYAMDMSLKSIRALRSMEPVDWKMIARECEVSLKRLDRELSMHRSWIAEFKYHRGICYRQDHHLTHAHDCFTEAVKLYRDDEPSQQTSDYRYALAECILHMELPKEDIDPFFENVLKHLTPLKVDSEEQVISKNILIIRFLMLKNKHSALSKEELVKIANLKSLFQELGDRHPVLMKNYIDLNLSLGHKLVEAKYYEEAVHSNPLRSFREASPSKEKLLSLDQDAKNHLIKLAEAYCGWVALDFSAYSDTGIRNIITCLSHIDHRQKKDEIAKCARVFKNNTGKYQLLLAMEKAKSENEKLKAEQKASAPKPASPTIESKEQPKKANRVRMFGAGSPGPGYVLQENYSKKPSRVTGDPAERERKKRLERSLKNRAKLQSEEFKRIKEQQQKVREIKMFRAEVQSIARKQQEEMTEELARKEQVFRYVESLLLRSLSVGTMFHQNSFFVSDSKDEIFPRKKLI